ncbi:MAG: ATPase [Firmicutes bacterium]|nr:ATPase [Bacillota bacterium]
MKLMALLDELEQFVENSRRLPLTDKIIMDGDQLLDYLDQIRDALPEEIEEAKRIYRDRERVITDAKYEADHMVEETRMQMNRMVENHEVSKQAQSIAEEIIEQARKVAREIRQGANEYADDVLRELEEIMDRAGINLEQSIRAVKSGREELRKTKGA